MTSEEDPKVVNFRAVGAKGVGCRRLSLIIDSNQVLGIRTGSFDLSDYHYDVRNVCLVQQKKLLVFNVELKK